MLELKLLALCVRVCLEYLQRVQCGLFNIDCWLAAENSLLFYIWQVNLSLPEVEIHWTELDTQLRKENGATELTHDRIKNGNMTITTTLFLQLLITVCGAYLI